MGPNVELAIAYIGALIAAAILGAIVAAVRKP